jgi:type II secretory pathway pseudopilin PulG
VELLVVIAIIGILAGLLLPVLSKAKSRAISTVDVNNLKQQTLALHLYASESNDRLPWPNWLRGDGTNQVGWLYTFNPAAKGPARFKLETGSFWKTLHNPKLYMCPMDKTDAPLFAQRYQQISSYVMNGAVCGYDRILPPLKLGEFAATAVAFWETDEDEPYNFNDGSSFPKQGVSPRHNRGAIEGTFGGAVGYIKFDRWYELADATNRNELWCYPGTPNGR